MADGVSGLPGLAVWSPVVEEPSADREHAQTHLHSMVVLIAVAHQ